MIVSTTDSNAARLPDALRSRSEQNGASAAGRRPTRR